MCRSRRELSKNSNEYLLAKIGVDTAENEPLEVWGKIQFNIQSCPYPGRAVRGADVLLVGPEGLLRVAGISVLVHLLAKLAKFRSIQLDTLRERKTQRSETK